MWNVCFGKREETERSSFPGTGSAAADENLRLRGISSETNETGYL